MDEFIFRTENPRNRLMLELMARGGMRGSEVLKITLDDLDDRKIVIRDPKSGKDIEVFSRDCARGAWITRRCD